MATSRNLLMLVCAASVKGETLKDVPAISFKDLLQGNAPGVQFTSSSGQPGASSSLRIRGMGSFNASNSPLYVIDGVPMRSGTINAFMSRMWLEIMSTIKSSDIEAAYGDKTRRRRFTLRFACC